MPKTPVKSKPSKKQAEIIAALPVPPEFVWSLWEGMVKTSKDYLTAIGAPDLAMQMVDDLSDLGFYLAECNQHPEMFGKDRFDIEKIVLESVNHIAQGGGTFAGPWTETVPRDIQPVTMPAPILASVPAGELLTGRDPGQPAG